MNEQNSYITTDNTQVDGNNHQPEFGVKLREAREAAGLSIVDVTETLKLKEDLIKALENSQIEKLPVTAFTQGYIRSYCRLLKLSAEELIEQYNKMMPHQEVPLVQTSGVSVQKTSGDGHVKIVTFFLVAAGLFLFSLWWLQNDINSPVSNQPEAVNEVRENIIESDVAEPVAEIQEDAQSSIEQAPVETTEVIISQPEQASSPQSTSIPAEITEPAVVKPRQVVPGDDILVVRSNGDSWTEIEDANGQRLLFQLIRAGDFHQLQGRAPFRIFLGNAPSVEITVNDKAIDLSTHIRQNNIAHISVKGNANTQTVRGLVRAASDNTNNGNEQQAE